MESYQDVINRLSTHLVEIEQGIQEPIAACANRYRIAAEAICKAVIISQGGSPTGNLQALISTAAKVIKITETARESALFNANMNLIRELGNAYSHDNSTTPAADRDDQKTALDALSKAIKISFFGEADREAPRLPDLLKAMFAPRLLKKSSYENPRSEEVVRLCYTRQAVHTAISRNDHKIRLVYDYVVAELGGGVTRGMLFLRSKSAVERCMTDLLENITSLPSALTIITPRLYRDNGKEVEREKSIRSIIKKIQKPGLTSNVTIDYFDSFVWNSCLPEEVRTAPPQTVGVANFIPQTLEPVADQEGGTANQSANNYITQLLLDSREDNPIHVIIGPAGIGKTTFCDAAADYIGQRSQKRVILLSSTDFRDLSTSEPINSVGDLYKVAAKNGLLEENPIEKHNFEINLACGNFVLIIDGFDELESHLGESLHYGNFMESLIELEDCFQKVLVIMTVRDYAHDRFGKLNYVSLRRLRGFTDEDTDRYLRGRLPRERIPEAKRLLLEFSEGGSNNAHTVPLYASLICDFLNEDPQDSGDIQCATDSKYFANNTPLDMLVKKVVDREIAKQSLGDIRPDDFFDILIEVIRSPLRTINRDSLLSYAIACCGDGQKIKSENFFRNPFLSWEGDNARFRYDSLTHFFKSRLLADKIGSGRFTEQPSIEFLSEMYKGEGILFDEFLKVLPACHAKDESAVTWFQGMIEFASKTQEPSPTWRKAVSGFLYWALSADHGKADRSDTLNRLYGGKCWYGLSIFGRFYPLRLSYARVTQGCIENYTSIVSCEYDDGEPVFFNTWIDYDDKSLPEKINRRMFASDCRFGAGLTQSFRAKDRAEESGAIEIRDNLYKILKVGFRSNNFFWKSQGLYRNVTIVGRKSLDIYLDTLVREGVLELQRSHSGTEIGYEVARDWKTDARKLIEEKNITGRMSKIVAQFRQE